MIVRIPGSPAKKMLAASCPRLPDIKIRATQLVNFLRLIESTPVAELQGVRWKEGR